jgi:hypothetical protein
MKVILALEADNRIWIVKKTRKGLYQMVKFKGMERKACSWGVKRCLIYT